MTLKHITSTLERELSAEITRQIIQQIETYDRIHLHRSLLTNNALWGVIDIFDFFSTER
jgi:hypothetical protein